MKIDCSKTENYLRECKRMCDASYDKLTKCTKCIMYRSNESFCLGRQMQNPQEAIAIVQQWSDEHPIKTYAEDFFSKFPSAERKCDGAPRTPWCYIYGTECNSVSSLRDVCSDCWNRPMEEKS